MALFKTNIILIFLWQLMASSVVSQQTVYRFINFAERDGILDKAIYSFAQDNLGFIWIGTSSGLQRYDGAVFTKYKSNKDEEYRQISNILEKVVFDKHLNRLWLKSTTDVQYFDLKDYSFHRIPALNSLIIDSKGQIIDIISINENKIWVLLESKIMEFDVVKNLLTEININNQDKDNRSFVKAMKYGHDTVLIATNNSFITYNLTNKSNSTLTISRKSEIHDFCIDYVKNLVWATNLNEIMQIDLNNGKIEYISFRDNDQKINKDVSLNKICIFDTDKLWVNNATIYNTSNNYFETIKKADGEYDNQLIYVNSLFLDREQNLWRGSYGSGMSVLPRDNFLVKNYDLKTKEGYVIEPYSSVKINGRPIVLVAGNPLRGIHLTNIETGEKSIISKGIAPSALNGYSLIKSDTGLIFFSDGIQIYQVDIDNKTLTPKFLRSESKRKYLLKSMIFDMDNDIWASDNEYVYKINLKSEAVDTFLLEVIDTLKSNYEYYYFMPKDLGNNGYPLFVSSSGVFQYQKIDNTISKLEFPSSNTLKNIIQPNDVLMDPKGDYWIASLVNGLFYFKTKEKKLLNLNSSNSVLVSDYIQTLTRESENLILVGTTTTVHRLNLSTGKFINKLSKQAGFYRDDAGYDVFVEYPYLLKNNYGVFDLIDLSKKNKKVINKPIITKLKIIGKEIVHIPCTSDTTIRLSANQNEIEINFSSLSFANSNYNSYQYRLIGLDSNWINTTNSYVGYDRLPSGTFTFELFAMNSNGDKSDTPMVINFIISKPYYLTWWFISLSLGIIAAIAYTLHQIKIRLIRKEERLKSAYEKQLAEVEMKALRAQMNPHFIFNSLNSIQRFIFEKDEYAASQYLTKFSRLIRHILDQSNQAFISLQSELDLIKLYVEMENLRFDNKFKFELNIGPEINTSWMLPSMVIQAHLENAIWHGLLHKEDKGVLKLSFYKYSVNQIIITIEDNGVGRQKSMALKSKQLLKKKSYGSQISSSRIEHLNNLYEVASSINIIDIEDKEHPNITGTKIEIIIPIIENIESQQ